ncbi:hypothetical protein OROHE_017737 [Orobanche hederae]
MCKVSIRSCPKSYSYTKMWKSSTAKMMRVVMIWWLLWVAPVFTEVDEHTKYKDPKQPPDARLEDLMTRMTLEEKIGQMTQIDRTIASPAIVTKYLVGSVISDAGSYPSLKASVEEWVKMVNDFQKGALSTRLGIPIIYGTYAVHGHNNVYGATIFPHNIGIGVTRTKVAACAMYFVGDGGTARGIDEGNTTIDFNELLRIHMPPYIDSIAKGVATVMVAYSSLNGQKMHANRDLVTDYLKNKLQFKGFVNSAWKGIDRITYPPGANYSHSIQAGVLAGIDMQSRKVKASLIASHRPLLPLQKKVQKVLVAGTHADNLGYQCGGYTVGFQGVRGNDLIVGTTILGAVKKTVHNSTQVVYMKNPSRRLVKSHNFSYAIVAVGEVPYAEMFGDSTNLRIPEHGRCTIKNVCGTVRCVVIIVSGRPVVIQPYLARIDALVAAWLPGTEGQGVADVLFGDYGFTGTLARTWFKSVDQLPMNVGDSHYDPL